MMWPPAHSLVSSPAEPRVEVVVPKVEARFAYRKIGLLLYRPSEDPAPWERSHTLWKQTSLDLVAEIEYCLFRSDLTKPEVAVSHR